MAGIAAGQAADPEVEFKEFKERVYQQKRKQILDEIIDLKNGTHSGYNEKVLQLKRQRDYTLRMNERYQVLELQSIEDEYTATVERVKKDAETTLEQAEKKLRQELEQYRNELRDDFKHRGDPKESIMNDIDVSGRKHRSTKDKQRKKLFENGTTRVYSGAKRGRRGKGGGTDKYPVLKLSVTKHQNLESWEMEQDIRHMNNIQGVSSRGRRPPAKLAGMTANGR